MIVLILSPQALGAAEKPPHFCRACQWLGKHPMGTRPLSLHLPGAAARQKEVDQYMTGERA